MEHAGRYAHTTRALVPAVKNVSGARELSRILGGRLEDSHRTLEGILQRPG